MHVPATPQTVGDFVRKKRVEAGLSQSQVAARIGVSVSMVKRWEQNENQPVGRFLEQAVMFLGFNPVNAGCEPNRTT
jgi:transcriptional regulator with XRE-family HTH domain